MNKNSYNGNSIQVLSDYEHTRSRPSVYISDVYSDGLHHLLWEIVDNATDEIESGDATEIFITKHKDNSISVSDNGRGIPTDMHKKGILTCDVIFTMLNSGGKFGGENSAFNNSAGLNGMGASIVCFLSSFLEVHIKRDGKEYCRRYENGKPTKKELEVTKTVGRKDTGTKVRFMADKSIFKCDISYDKEKISRRIRNLAFINPNVHYRLTWEEGDKSEIIDYKYSNGIEDFMKYIAKDKKLLHDVIHIRGKASEQCHVDMAFVYDTEFSDTIYSFANNVATTEHGVHYNSALDALCKNITETAKNNGLFKGIDLEPAKSDIQEGLNLIISVKVPNPEFAGQTKTKLNNEELRKSLGDWMLEQIEKAFKKDKEIAKVIANKIADSMKARDAARKAKSLSRKKSTIDSLTLPGKLADCTSKNPELCELFVVEGDSAGGTAKDARDRVFQAVLPLRGKVLNVGKCTLNKALENKEIGAIISALGINVSQRECDLETLRYHKIILTCDSDDDGSHITCLLLTLFYNFMRKLIEEGHVYVADLPLYRVTYQNKPIYLKDDEALKIFKEEHLNAKLEISRFKGLGEMDPEPFSEIAMNPATRSIKQIVLADQVETNEIVNCLMGDDIASRKEFLKKNLKFAEGE